MSKEDLRVFIKKVDMLNALVESLEKVPGRQAELENCSNHDQVVSLAKSWGFDISRRWGEKSFDTK